MDNRSIHSGGISVSTIAIEQQEIIYKLGAFSQLLFSTKMVIMIVFIFMLTILIDKLIRKIHESFRNHMSIIHFIMDTFITCRNPKGSIP